MLKLKILGIQEVSDRLDHILHGKHSRFGQALERVAIEVESTAKREGFEEGRKPPGRSKSKRLHAPFGRLRSSITHRVDKAGLRAFVGTNVIYARIHEFGGVIEPKSARFLVFKVDDRWIRTSRVTIPARPYLQPALESSRGMIEQLFAGEIDKLLDGR